MLLCCYVFGIKDRDCVSLAIGYVRFVKSAIMVAAGDILKVLLKLKTQTQTFY